MTAERERCMYFLEVHRSSEDDWDYTVYNENMEDLDGGRYGEGRNLSFYEACEEIIVFCGIDEFDCSIITCLSDMQEGSNWS